MSFANAVRVSPTAMTAEKEPDGSGRDAAMTTARALLRGRVLAASALMAIAKSDGRSARSGCTSLSTLIVPSPSKRPPSACAMSFVSMILLIDQTDI